MQPLITILKSFQEKANTTEKIKKLITGWNPNIIIRAMDTSDVYTFIVADLKISAILSGEINSDHQVTVEGNQDVLIEIFTGKVNPAQALLDGLIAVYGEQKDQVKLDIITMMLWD